MQRGRLALSWSFEQFYCFGVKQLCFPRNAHIDAGAQRVQQRTDCIEAKGIGQPRIFRFLPSGKHFHEVIPHRAHRYPIDAGRQELEVQHIACLLRKPAFAPSLFQFPINPWHGHVRKRDRDEESYQGKQMQIKSLFHSFNHSISVYEYYKWNRWYNGYSSTGNAF